MLTTRLLSSTAAIATSLRRFSTAENQLFVEAWKKVAPNIDPPKLPLSFKQTKPEISCSIPPKLTLNVHLLYSSEVDSKEVDMVTIPATTGPMSIRPGHMATMTELNPGLLSLHEGDETTKYFISGGYALVHPNAITDIVALEAVPIDNIDPNLVQKRLVEFSDKLVSATSEFDKAQARVGVDVHTAVTSALQG